MSRVFPHIVLIINGWIFLYFPLATWNLPGIVAALAAWSEYSVHFHPHPACRRLESEVEKVVCRPETISIVKEKQDGLSGNVEPAPDKL
jgi:hypothetical protein